MVMKVASFRLALGLLDVSSGFEYGSSWTGDHVDHGDEGCIVAVATSPGASGLKQAVQVLHARIHTGRRPASDDTRSAWVDNVAKALRTGSSSALSPMSSVV